MSQIYWSKETLKRKIHSRKLTLEKMGVRQVSSIIKWLESR